MHGHLLYHNGKLTQIFVPEVEFCFNKYLKGGSSLELRSSGWKLEKYGVKHKRGGLDHIVKAFINWN